MVGVYELWYTEKVYVGNSKDLLRRTTQHEVFKKLGKPNKVVIAKEMPNSTAAERGLGYQQLGFGRL